MAVQTQLATWKAVLLKALLPEATEKASMETFETHNISNVKVQGYKKKFLNESASRIARTKSQLLIKVQTFDFATYKKTLSVTEQNILEDLGAALELLNCKTISLLEEDIMKLFLQLFGLQEKVAKENIAYLIQPLLKSIIVDVAHLLKPYFIFQEYKSKKNKGSSRHMENVLSNKSINLPSAQSLEDSLEDQEDHLLKQADAQISYQPLKELVQNYMKYIQKQLRKQLNSIKQRQQVCRICSRKIKLLCIQKHVKLCQKLSDMQQKLQDKDLIYESLLQEIRGEFQQLNKNEEKSPREDSLKKVIKVLFVCDEKARKERCIRRRSESDMVVNCQRNVRFSWAIHLYEYESVHGNHEKLAAILQTQQQRVIIQKNITWLEDLLLEEEIAKQMQNISTTKIKQLINTSTESCHSDSSKSIKQRERVYTFSINQKDQVVSDSDSEHSNQKLLEESSLKDTASKFTYQLKKMQSRPCFESLEPQFMADTKNYASLQQLPTPLDQSQNTLTLENFDILKTVGQGTYGKVYMVRRKQTNDIYALKIIKLQQGSSDKDLQNITTEHKIFKKIAGDHLVKAPFSFSQKGKHIFVLEFMPGGDLRKLLTKEVYFEEEAAKFYLAQIILAIEHLHSYDIIHRDLKPENLVIAGDGHLKLTDFGLSAIKMQEMIKNSLNTKHQKLPVRRSAKRRTAIHKRHGGQVTLIGTPDYIAPEIINQLSTNNKSIDWWSLGVMAYELIIGTRPFCADTIEEVVENIRAYNIEWPDVGEEQGMISSHAKDLIQQLLDRDFINRLGANGASEIKNHLFFKGVDWNNIKYQKPPFMPDISEALKSSTAPEDHLLRDDLKNHIRKSPRAPQKLKLQKFVRYDLLGSQTIQNFQKTVSEHTDKMKKLSSCSKFNLSELDSYQQLTVSSID